jgi:hypothetical protein
MINELFFSSSGSNIVLDEAYYVLRKMVSLWARKELELDFNVYIDLNSESRHQLQNAILDFEAPLEYDRLLNRPDFFKTRIIEKNKIEEQIRSQIDRVLEKRQRTLNELTPLEDKEVIARFLSQFDFSRTEEIFNDLSISYEFRIDIEKIITGENRDSDLEIIHRMILFILGLKSSIGFDKRAIELFDLKHKIPELEASINYLLDKELLGLYSTDDIVKIFSNLFWALNKTNHYQNIYDTIYKGKTRGGQPITCEIEFLFKKIYSPLKEFKRKDQNKSEFHYPKTYRIQVFDSSTTPNPSISINEITKVTRNSSFNIIKEMKRIMGHDFKYNEISDEHSMGRRIYNYINSDKTCFDIIKDILPTSEINLS